MIRDISHHLPKVQFTYCKSIKPKTLTLLNYSINYLSRLPQTKRSPLLEPLQLFLCLSHPSLLIFPIYRSAVFLYHPSPPKKLLLSRSGSQEGLLSCLFSPQKNKDCFAHNKFELFLLTMPPLLLSNNLTALRKDKNLCFVNACLQVLFAIKEIREFFQAVDPEAFPTSWPVSKELCRIFASDGNYEISAANFRR